MYGHNKIWFLSSCISSNKHLKIVLNSRSGSGKPDPDLEGVELLFHQKGGSASFGAKMVLSVNGVDLSCLNSITGST
jgi:hypothetical protein